MKRQYTQLFSGKYVILFTSKFRQLYLVNAVVGIAIRSADTKGKLRE